MPPELLIFDKDDTLIDYFGDTIEGAVAFVCEQATKGERDCVVATMADKNWKKDLGAFDPYLKGYYGGEELQSKRKLGFYITDDESVRDIDDDYEEDPLDRNWGEKPRLLHRKSGKVFDWRREYVNTHFTSNPAAKKTAWDDWNVINKAFVKDMELIKRKHCPGKHQELNSLMIGNEPDIRCITTDPATPLIVVEPYSLWPTRDNTRVLVDTLYKGTSTALTFDQLYSIGTGTEGSHDLVAESVIATIEGIQFRFSRNVQLGIRVAEERFTEGKKIRIV